MVMPLDKFEILIGKEFLRSDHAIIFPFKNRLVILSERKPCVVPTMMRKSNASVWFVMSPSFNPINRGVHEWTTSF